MTMMFGGCDCAPVWTGAVWAGAGRIDAPSVAMTMPRTASDFSMDGLPRWTGGQCSEDRPPSDAQHRVDQDARRRRADYGGAQPVDDGAVHRNDRRQAAAPPDDRGGSRRPDAFVVAERRLARLR